MGGSFVLYFRTCFANFVMGGSFVLYFHSLAHCIRSFVLWKQINACENTIRQHFPWRNRYLLSTAFNNWFELNNQTYEYNTRSYYRKWSAAFQPQKSKLWPKANLTSEVLPCNHRKQTLTESKLNLYKITSINCRTTVVIYINILI